MSIALPAGAILDDEEPQQWHAQPLATQAAETQEGAEAEAAEDGEACGEEEAAEEEGDDIDVDEDGETEGPWLGASARAALYAAEAAAEGDTEAMADDAQAAYGDGDEAGDEDDAALPPAGDLTAAFFEELAASQSERHDRKRRRPGAGDSDDDDDEYRQRPAFAIPAHLMRTYDPNSTAPPATAEEYLLRVRMEAAACPRVKVSNIDPRAFAHRQTAYVPDMGGVPLPADLACLPSEQWQNEFAADFAQARQQLLCFAANNSAMRKLPPPPHAPSKRDYPAWISYCVGDLLSQLFPSASAAAAAAAASAPASSAAAPRVLPHFPSLSLLVSMDQVQTKGVLMQLMQFGCDTIRKRQEAVEAAERKEHSGGATALAASLPAFPFPSHAYTLWLYSLLLKVDKPLAAHISAGMRAAYRSFCWLRAHHNTPQADTVKHLNMLITLLDRGFGQAVPCTQVQQQQKQLQHKLYHRTQEQHSEEAT